MVLGIMTRRMEAERIVGSLRNLSCILRGVFIKKSFALAVSSA